jgi:hypothetical protein
MPAACGEGCPSTHLVVGVGVLLPKVQSGTDATATICSAAAAVFYSDAQLILAATAAGFALRGLCRGCRQADAQLRLALPLQLALIQIERRLCHCGCLALRGLVDRRCHRLRQLLPASTRRWMVGTGRWGAASPCWVLQSGAGRSLKWLAPDGRLQLKGGGHTIHMHSLHAEAVAVEAQSAAASGGGSGGGDM